MRGYSERGALMPCRYQVGIPNNAGVSRPKMIHCA